MTVAGRHPNPRRSPHNLHGFCDRPAQVFPMLPVDRKRRTSNVADMCVNPILPPGRSWLNQVKILCGITCSVKAIQLQWARCSRRNSMTQVVIDDPNGFETVYSSDSSSPAAPYIKEYN